MAETVTIVTEDGTSITTPASPYSGSARPQLSGRLASSGESAAEALFSSLLTEAASSECRLPFRGTEFQSFGLPPKGARLDHKAASASQDARVAFAGCREGYQPAPHSDPGASVTHSSRQDASGERGSPASARRTHARAFAHPISKAWRFRNVNLRGLPNSDGAAR